MKSKTLSKFDIFSTRTVKPYVGKTPEDTKPFSQLSNFIRITHKFEWRASFVGWTIRLQLSIVSLTYQIHPQ